MHHREVSCGWKVNGTTLILCPMVDGFSSIERSGSAVTVVVNAVPAFSLC
jgi:hypothetical protein